MSLAFSVGCTTIEKSTFTPSGRPEVVIATNDVGRIKSLLIGDLLNHGYTIESDTQYALTLTRPTKGMESVAASMVAGNSYSVNTRYATYNFVHLDNGIRVIASMGWRAQMPGGQVNNQPLNDGNVYNTFQTQLFEIKAMIEKDTLGVPAEAILPWVVSEESEIESENMNDEDIDDDEDDQDEDDQDENMPYEFADECRGRIYEIHGRRIRKAERQERIHDVIHAYSAVAFRYRKDYGEFDVRDMHSNFLRMTDTIVKLNYDPTYAFRTLIELLFELGEFVEEYSLVIEWALDATTDYLDDDEKILEKLLKVCEVEEGDLSSGNEDTKRMAECKSRIESILFGTEPIEEKPEPVIIKDTDKELDRLMKELNKLSKMK